MSYAKSISWAITASAIVALHATPAAAADQSDVEFQPPGHSFSVSLPTPPRYSRRSTSTIIGKIHTDVWGSKQSGSDYSVAITDLPSIALWFNSADSLFEKARDKMLETLGARQAGLRTLKRGQFQQELDYFIAGQIGAPARRGRAWFALVEDKLIVVTALVPLSTSSDLDRYFSKVVPDVATTLARR